jgi:predicted SnoaL-like aldol condensation-catalyzing enzyme
MARMIVKYAGALWVAVLVMCAPGQASQNRADSNKAIVMQFVRDAFVVHDLQRAGQLLRPDYIQHDPALADGRRAFVTFFTSFFRARPRAHLVVKHIFVDGDYVIVHAYLAGAHLVPGPDPQGASVDIFRIQGDRIAEHWGVIQLRPKVSANSHPFF